MKIAAVLVFMYIAFIGVSTFGEGKKEMKKWFNHSSCKKMKIIEFKSASNNTISREATVTDFEYIKSFQNQIRQLPIEGDLMKKMGPNATKLSLEFFCDEQIEIIEFYNSKIKTPGTSFLGQSEIETEIWSEIQTHLAKPELGKRLPKLKNVELNFSDFSIKYLQYEDRTPKDTTASLYVEVFEVTKKDDKKVQIVEVTSGQLPPENVDFAIGKKIYTLITFSTDESSLHPRQMIIKKK